MSGHHVSGALGFVSATGKPAGMLGRKTHGSNMLISSHG